MEVLAQMPHRSLYFTEYATGMQFLRAVTECCTRGIADLAAEELRDALLPLGLGAALREAPRDAALGGAVDVQRRRQATCAGASKSSRQADRGV